MQEYGRKLQAATKACFGDRLKDMHEVGSILTLPDSRGRGYASALIRVMTAEVRSYLPLYTVVTDTHPSG